MNTVVISAFPACGKTYACNHFADKYLMLDSDSSKFSWILDENGNPTKKRNPNFPGNYIEHIRRNLGKVDFIFVSSHLAVRQALEDAKIKYYTVYPNYGMKNEWVGRMYLRGNTDSEILFIANNFDKFVSEVAQEPHGLGIFRLNSNEYLPLNFLHSLKGNDFYYFPS